MANNNVRSEKRLVEVYLEEHGVESVVNEALNHLLRDRPADPFGELGRLLKERSKAGKGLNEIQGRVLWGTDDAVMYEVQLDTDNGRFSAQVSDVQAANRFQQVTADGFEQVVNSTLTKGLLGQDPSDLETIDSLIAGLDDTEDKSVIGSNTIYAASMAACRAGAASKDVELFRYIGQIAGKSEFCIPVPWVRAISLEQEEVGLVPTGAESFQEALKVCMEIIKTLRSTGAGEIDNLETAVNKVLSTITELDLAMKVKIAISVVDPEEFHRMETSKEDTSVEELEEGGESKQQEDVDKTKKKQDKKDTKGKKPGGKAAEEQKEPEDVKPKGKAFIDRSKALTVVNGLLTDDTKKGMLVVVENIFEPSQTKEMEHFVEEYGETVVLFNTATPKSSNKDGEATSQADEGEGKAAEGKSSEESEGKAGEGKETDEVDDLINQAKRNQESLDDEDDLPPFNGDKLYVGTPTSDICTISELIQECEMFQSQGQAVVVAFPQGAYDDFPADFTVGMGVGLIKLGDFKSQSNLPKVNQLIRLEKQLTNDAFYAGGRFRCPM